MAELVHIVGTLMGYRNLPDGGRREILGIEEEQRPQGGPAAHSMVSVVTSGGSRVASYVSWINYYDLDRISLDEPGAWTLVEPGQPYEADVIWDPYATTAAGEGVPLPGVSVPEAAADAAVAV